MKKITLAKALVSKLHRPLPRSSQESRRLLKVLNDSLQKQLDTGYPYRLEDSSQHTHAHVQSILENPLFEAERPRRRLSRTDSLRNGTISMHGLQYWIKHPLDAFQQGVSTGAATLDTAKLCLELQHKKCVATSVSKRNGMCDTAGTGSTVLSWLWSSGLEESGQYLKDQRFISLLVPFLVIEQRYDVIYGWFLRLGRDGAQKAEMMSQRSHMAQSNVLLDLVRSEKSYGAGLGASMLHFTEYFRRKPTGPVSLSQTLFRPAGNFLARGLAKPGEPAAVPEETLSSFIATSREWVEEGCLPDIILQIHHHTPRPQLAVEYLQRLPTNKIDSLKAYQRHALVHTSLKAAELLLAKGDEANARWITEFIQTNFAEDIGAEVDSKPTPKKDAEQEAYHLGLLESLAVH